MQPGQQALGSAMQLDRRPGAERHAQLHQSQKSSRTGGAATPPFGKLRAGSFENRERCGSLSWLVPGIKAKDGPAPGSEGKWLAKLLFRAKNSLALEEIREAARLAFPILRSDPKS